MDHDCASELFLTASPWADQITGARRVAKRTRSIPTNGRRCRPQLQVPISHACHRWRHAHFVVYRFARMQEEILAEADHLPSRSLRQQLALPWPCARS